MLEILTHFQRCQASNRIKGGLYEIFDRPVFQETIHLVLRNAQRVPVKHPMLSVFLASSKKGCSRIAQEPFHEKFVEKYRPKLVPPD